MPPPADQTAAARRSFLRTAAWGGGIVGLGGLAGFAANRLFRGKSPAKRPRPALGDEFTYDVARFQKSDPALLVGEELARFPAGLERPRNLAAGADGSIYVCGDGGIRKFGAKGEPLASIPVDGPVYALAVRPAGEILAGLPGKLLVCPASGGDPAVWDGLPAGLLPTSIALAGGDVYVADAGNRVVLRLDASGKTLGAIGKRDPERGIEGFVVPSPYFCVRMAPDGLLRITNPGAHKIEAWTTDGALEVGWGKASFAAEGFCGCCNPVSFDVFPDGSFVTCEKGLPRVKLYDSHGGFTGLLAGPEAFPEYLHAANAGTPETAGAGLYAAIDPQGRVLVLDAIAAEVRVLKRKERAHD